MTIFLFCKREILKKKTLVVCVDLNWNNFSLMSILLSVFSFGGGILEIIDYFLSPPPSLLNWLKDRIRNIE